MTLEEFAEKFKALLREAEDAGLDVDAFCDVAERIMESSWRDDDVA